MKDNVMLKSSAMSPAPCRRNLNVESAANVLDSAIADLNDAVDALNSHLQPLLSDERPSTAAEDRERGGSEVADRIMSSADQIRCRTARIRDLIDRL
jgi:hypothetical protein